MKYWSKVNGQETFANDVEYIKAVEQAYLSDEMTCSFREYVESDDAFYTDYDIVCALETDTIGSSFLADLCDDVTQIDDTLVMSDGYTLNLDRDDNGLYEELCAEYPGIVD